MKKLLAVIALSSLSSTAFASAAGGNGCGWGQMGFDGQSGAASHMLGLTTNGSSGNNTFGVTTGTNGCSASGTGAITGSPEFFSLPNEVPVCIACCCFSVFSC